MYVWRALGDAFLWGSATFVVLSFAVWFFTGSPPYPLALQVEHSNNAVHRPAGVSSGVSLHPIGDPFDARLLDVVDGDVVHLTKLSDGELVRVALIGIVAPKMTHPYGPQVVSDLSRGLEGKLLSVLPYGKDRYDRMLGEVFFKEDNGDVKNVSVNQRMIISGNARVDYSYSMYDWGLDEDKARADRVGLWGIADDDVELMDYRAKIR